MVSRTAASPRALQRSLALWMSDQLCPLLPYVGAHACWTSSDQYLVGMAGWIFAGTILLMLMGISENIESRKAERSSVRSSVPVLETRAPALQSPHVLDVKAVAVRQLTDVSAA